MLRFVVPLLCTLSAVTSLQSKYTPFRVAYPSAASESQIKFAIENKFDDTGPGAKKPEFAYKTYQTLEDALVAFVDDPDTQLPEKEKAIAVQKLVSKYNMLKKPTPEYFQNPQKYSVFEVEKPFVQQISPVSYSGPFDDNVVRSGSSNLGTLPNENQDFLISDPNKSRKFYKIKGSPLSLAHYSRDDGKSEFTQLKSYPKYYYSYGVNDKTTGDQKEVAERREGPTVHGFYSFTDADGKQRTVHYTADDHKGFRATVEKAPSFFS